MRRLIAALAFVAGCTSVIHYPTEREVATARQTDPAATVESLTHGRKRYVAKCAGCHYLRSPRDETPDEWPGVLEEMTAKAKCSVADRKAITQYLLAVSGTPDAPR
ncbi:MAG TPA: hypothetical protein VFF73_29300 [Planctomycetota bacterium]|nr:hypothetical protein [Planctomycetota bacterium]